jgi:hypothetical protein
MAKTWKIKWTRYGYTFLAGNLKGTSRYGGTRLHGGIILKTDLKET